MDHRFFLVATSLQKNTEAIILNNNRGGIIRAVVDDEIFHSAEEGTNMIRTFNETEGPQKNGVEQNLHKWATLLPYNIHWSKGMNSERSGIIKMLFSIHKVTMQDR